MKEKHSESIAKCVQPRRNTSEVERTAIDRMKKLSHTKKRRYHEGTMQVILRRNYDRFGLRRWSFVSRKYTTTSQMSVYSLEQVARGIGLYMNSNKTDSRVLMITEKSLKSVNHFPYLGSNISFAECNVNLRRDKAWTATDRLSTIKKSNLSDKITLELFKVKSVLVQLH